MKILKADSTLGMSVFWSSIFCPSVCYPKVLIYLLTPSHTPWSRVFFGS